MFSIVRFAFIIGVMLFTASYAASSKGLDTSWDMRYIDLSKAHREGRYDEAIQIADELIAVLKANSLLSSERMSSVMTKLGRIKSDQALYAEAHPHFIQALELSEKIFGVNSRDYEYSLMDVAGNHADQRQFEKAEEIYLQLLTLKEAKKDKQLSDIQVPLQALAHIYYEQGRLDDAERHILRALESSKADVMGVKFDGSAHAWQSLGAIDAARGKNKDAIAWHEKALKVLDKEFADSKKKWETAGNANYARLIACHERLAKLHGAIHNTKEAKKHEKRANQLKAEQPGEPMQLPEPWRQGVLPLR
ncbi:tetratricopeptide repeat protein [Permianibacter aggregans]|uniref:Tetratricopeptide repeat protein n=1 Tax=Permianibacter aggregans TaxID=1510150 RepID=A0A4R6UMU7_9GAMM|nr:tetratricopeptide repeat protein [Permianibacter aggregans]QGX41027.1 tetratricopeptide repeat protein [Permianibacter aggregans]TDQ48092.1 tetratricopeptide repeat protein [Permianibacter aggregans]